MAGQCANFSFPATTLSVESSAGQYAWIPSCTDLVLKPKSGTPPYTFTVAPALHPPFNITTVGSEGVTWRVQLQWAVPFFVSLTDSTGLTWSYGPLHAGQGDESCLVSLGPHASIAALIGTAIGALVLGAAFTVLALFLVDRRRNTPRGTWIPFQFMGGKSPLVATPYLDAPYSEGDTTQLLRTGSHYDLGYGDRRDQNASSATMSSFGQTTPRSGPALAIPYRTEPFDPNTLNPSRPGTEPGSPAGGIPGSPEERRSQVYVVHHDNGPAPVSIYAPDGAEVVELPPVYSGSSRRHPPTAGEGHAQPAGVNPRYGNQSGRVLPGPSTRIEKEHSVQYQGIPSPSHNSNLSYRDMPLLATLPSLQVVSVGSFLWSSTKFLTVGSWIFAAFWLFRLFVYWPWRSRLTRLPGPPPAGKVFGTHLPALMNPLTSPQRHEELRQQYGLNMRIHGMGYFDERFLTFDSVAINYILGRAADLFPKPWQSRRLVANLVGNGLFVAEGEDHRHQRKIISPAFSNLSLRGLQPIFFSKAIELRNTLSKVIKKGATSPADDGEKINGGSVVDMNNWLWRTTFDVIGLAGFSYSFDSLKNEENELYVAYRDMMTVGVKYGFTLSSMLDIWFPWFGKLFPNEDRNVIKNSKQIVNHIGTDIVRQKKAAIMKNRELGESGTGRDILSLLIGANMAEFSQRQLSDEALLTQISTLLFVGSDTTSIALAWILHLLTLNPDVQQKLREAITSKIPSTDSFSVQEQNAVLSLPYLDHVIKEALRLIPPLHSTLRVAAQDDRIPTSDGTEVFIRAGQFVHVAFEAFNTRKDVWGEDAFEFKPERWTNLPLAAKQSPGLVMGLMTFSLGPHSCPGYQFAMLEIKAVLASLIPAFTFEKSPSDKIRMANILMTRPFAGDDWLNSRLPLLVRPYEASPSQ
ncbi:hypothetical protein FRB90_001411 [Tulasnella sp. 427]|nr:hypothetical protein FRB90_001411 [Tulasnella sp. 427]